MNRHNRPRRQPEIRTVTDDQGGELATNRLSPPKGETLRKHKVKAHDQEVGDAPKGQRKVSKGYIEPMRKVLFAYPKTELSSLLVQKSKTPKQKKF